MASVYILYSQRLDRFYTGSCLEAISRIIQHQQQFFKDNFTAKADDWIPFLLINNLGYHEARQIEFHIKSMKSRNYILNLKQYPEMVEKLILRFEFSE